jgi:hypothetical protein
MAPHNNRLQRTVRGHRWRAASAPLHCALAPRFTRRRAAAELRRYAARSAVALCLSLLVSAGALSAELLASIELVNGGAILTCDYTQSSAHFLFTCRDTYAVFGLSCTAEPESEIGRANDNFLCPVPGGSAIEGSALRLKCTAYTAADRDYIRARAEQNPRALVEGRVPTHNCRSAKVDAE